MDRFLSHFVHRFDAKGRISIPAPFRAVLARDGFEGLFTCPALEAPAQDCGGKALLAEIDALIGSTPPYSAARDAVATALLGAGVILRMDSEGRVLIDEKAKARIGLSDEAVFVGQGYKFQIWRPERFEAHLADARAQLSRLRSEWGAFGQAGAP